MKRTFEFSPSPAECASEFASWSDMDQAAFFEHMCRIFNNWGAFQRDTQALGIGRELKKWPHALRLLREIVADAESPATGQSTIPTTPTSEEP